MTGYRSNKQIVKNRSPDWIQNLLGICDEYEEANIIVKFQDQNKVRTETTINGNSICWPDDLLKLWRKYPYMDVFLLVNKRKIVVEKVVIKDKIQ